MFFDTSRGAGAVGWSLSVAAMMHLALFLGCSSVGPPTLDRDRLDYSSAIAGSWQRQMLLNIVKLRYGDTPLFLEVTSVINQYTVEATGSLAATTGTGGGTEVLGVGGRYTDRPTVTYSPLAGQAFTNRLLTPVSPVALFALVQAGWPIDFIFRIAVRQINGVSNTSAAFVPKAADPEYERLIAAMRRIEDSGRLSLRILERRGDQGTVDESAVVLVIGEPTSGLETDLEIIRDVLGLTMPFGAFEVTYGAGATKPNQIAVLSRSMLEILMELGYTIDVPVEDIESGRTKPSIYHTGSRDIQAPISIHSGNSRPQSSLVAVEYRGRWFWIDDDDIDSKYTLTFMLILFSLSESGSTGQGPVLTVGAGG